MPGLGEKRLHEDDEICDDLHINKQVCYGDQNTLKELDDNDINTEEHTQHTQYVNYVYHDGDMYFDSYLNPVHYDDYYGYLAYDSNTNSYYTVFDNQIISDYNILANNIPLEPIYSFPLTNEFHEHFITEFDTVTKDRNNTTEAQCSTSNIPYLLPLVSNTVLTANQQVIMPQRTNTQTTESIIETEIPNLIPISQKKLQELQDRQSTLELQNDESTNFSSQTEQNDISVQTKTAQTQTKTTIVNKQTLKSVKTLSTLPVSQSQILTESSVKMSELKVLQTKEKEKKIFQEIEKILNEVNKIKPIVDFYSLINKLKFNCFGQLKAYTKDKCECGNSCCTYIKNQHLFTPNKCWNCYAYDVTMNYLNDDTKHKLKLKLSKIQTNYLIKSLQTILKDQINFRLICNDKCYDNICSYCKNSYTFTYITSMFNNYLNDSSSCLFNSCLLCYLQYCFSEKILPLQVITNKYQEKTLENFGHILNDFKIRNCRCKTLECKGFAVSVKDLDITDDVICFTYHDKPYCLFCYLHILDISNIFLSEPNKYFLYYTKQLESLNTELFILKNNYLKSSRSNKEIEFFYRKRKYLTEQIEILTLLKEKYKTILNKK